MKPEQALKVISKIAVTYPVLDEQDIWNDAMCEAIVALKKQVPQKPRIENSNLWYGHIPFCKNCNRRDVRGYKYCPECGQRLDWEG